MTTTNVYGTVSGAVAGYDAASYQSARAGAATGRDVSGTGKRKLGQYHDGTAFYCWYLCVTFNTSGVTGTVETERIYLYRTDDLSKDDDQPFTVRARTYDYANDGSYPTTAAFVPGASLAALPLLGEAASTAYGAGYTYITVTGSVGYLLGASQKVLLHSDKTETGTAITALAPDGYIEVADHTYSGTDHDPIISVVHGDRPEIPTIVSPVNVGYTGSISLTANADDPNGGNVHFHWYYSTDNWAHSTECANSPSAAAAEGSDVTIAWTVVGSPGDTIQLRCIADDGTNQSIDYASVTIANGTQTNMLLRRTAGADAVGDSIAGVVVSRPVSAPSSLSFRVDNFDAGEADIADDDELILTLQTETPGVGYYWRGFVREKRVGDIMEVYAEDIAYKFASLIVTRTLADTQTVGTVIRAIVEDPTGAEATGIVCDVAEAEDPLVEGAYISVTAFDGAGRPVLDWLDDLAEMTGAAWRCWHDGTNWRFSWWIPSANAAWGVACKDNIEYSAEDATNARVLNAPLVTRDRRQYVNRVWWWYDNSGTWALDSVETAAVTAGTEEPIEVVLSTRNLDAIAAESLANAYLAAYNATRVSIEDIQLFGIRDLDLNSDVTLTLASRGITATAYPITKIEYRLLEQGHVTSITVGDPALDGIQALQRLQRRLQDVTAEVRN